MTGCLPKVVHRGLVVGMITAVLAMSIAEAASPEMQAIGNAANDSRNAEEPPPKFLGPLSAAEEEGYGCLVAGGAALALTAAVGAPDTLLLFTGGASVPAASPFGVGLAVAGTAFASICAVGAIVAPTVIRLWSYYVIGEEIVKQP